MNSRTYRIISCLLVLSLAIFFLNDVAWCAGQEKVVFINERKQPDGSYSIYGYYDIFIVNSDGTGLKKLVENGINPVPSPDGKKIAFIPTRILEDQLGLSVINIDGTGRKDLIKEESDKDRLGFCCIRWSPDSRKIAYFSNSREKSKKGASLWIINVATGERKEIYAGIEDIPIISWSPDGKEILLMIPGLQPGPQPSHPEYEIINANTQRKTRLDIEKISKAPTMMLILDEKRLLYYKDDALWSVNRDGSNNKKLVHVGKIPELFIPKYAFEILDNKRVRIIVESGSNGNTHKLYDYSLDTKLLKTMASTDDPDFDGYFFSYDGSKIILEEEKRDPPTASLAAKDLKTGKTYVLCDSWRTFRQEIVMVYENVNWVAPSE